MQAVSQAIRTSKEQCLVTLMCCNPADGYVLTDLEGSSARQETGKEGLIHAKHPCHLSSATYDIENVCVASEQ